MGRPILARKCTPTSFWGLYIDSPSLFFCVCVFCPWPELQFGAFCPLFRLHGQRAGGPPSDPVCGFTNGDNEVWNLAKDQAHYDALVGMMNLREVGACGSCMRLCVCACRVLLFCLHAALQLCVCIQRCACAYSVVLFVCSVVCDAVCVYHGQQRLETLLAARWGPFLSLVCTSEPS